MAPAHIVVSPAGAVEDADADALELLGTTLEGLKAAPPGTFNATPSSPETQAAFPSEWEAAGRPDLAGQLTIRREDGQERRVTYLIAQRADGRFDVVLEPTDRPKAAPPSAFALGDVLRQWRDADRRLSAIDPSDPEWTAVRAEVTRLRDLYQAGFERRRGR